MEANSPDIDTVIMMAEKGMSETDNELRRQLYQDLFTYEKQFPISAYAVSIIEALCKVELINQNILHLKICWYLKEFLK